MIETKELRIRLGAAEILRGVSLQSGERRIVGILGPNGSGKSTLLKCVYRVLKPDGGAVLLDGRELRTYTAKQSAREMAVVAQHNNYNFEFEVLEVVLMGRSPHKKALEPDTAEDYRIAGEALGEVGMREFAHRGFNTLSGGEQQRVLLARALAQRTPCLILDEPTNHLDIRFQLQMLDAVKRQNFTVLCALHDLNLALLYCDYVYLLKDGQVWGQGAPQEAITAESIREVYGVRAEVRPYPDMEKSYVIYYPEDRPGPK
jgi:iron complex transport system ATP-binding protein